MAAADDLRGFTTEAFSDLRAIPGNTVPALLLELEKSPHKSIKPLAELLQGWRFLADTAFGEKDCNFFSVLLHANMLPPAPTSKSDGALRAAHGRRDPSWFHLRWFPLRMRCDRDGTCRVMVYIRSGWSDIHVDDFKTLWNYSHDLFNGELLPDSSANGQAVIRLHRADGGVVQARVSAADWPAWSGKWRASMASRLKYLHVEIVSGMERAGLPVNWGSDATRLVLLPTLAKRFPTEYAFAFLCLYGLWWPPETTLSIGQSARAAAPPAPSAASAMAPGRMAPATPEPAVPPAPVPETATASAAPNASDASTAPPAKRQRSGYIAGQPGGSKDRSPLRPSGPALDADADHATTGASAADSAVASPHAGTRRTPAHMHAAEIQD